MIPISISAPTCFPTLVSAQATSSMSIRLTWVPLPNTKCRNGILRGYRIIYHISEGGVTRHIDIKTPNATTRDVTGLRKYTSYRFYVRAYTNENGPMSNQLTNRTDEDGKYGSIVISLGSQF